MRTKRLKKTRNLLYNLVLDFFGIHIRIHVLFISLKSQPNVKLVKKVTQMLGMNSDYAFILFAQVPKLFKSKKIKIFQEIQCFSKV
jgi:hypothetical protein